MKSSLPSHPNPFRTENPLSLPALLAPFVIALVGALIAAFATNSAHAAAKKPADPPMQCGDPNLSTPQPIREVRIRPVGTKVFALPNGGTTDIGADLETLMTTAIAESLIFSPTDSADTPCQDHLEIRSAVSTLKLDVADFGFSIGFTPGGNLGPVTDINGKARVKVGTIAMDFSVWSCIAGRCSALGASTANQTVASGSLEFEIDFGQITTGPSLIANTPLGNVFRLMMKDGMRQLTLSQGINNLPWQSIVRDYTAGTGTLIFDGGTQNAIGPNQTFEVYAPTDASPVGVCNVFRSVAQVHTIGVNSVSSTAIVDKILDSRGIQVGDVVMIRKQPK